MAWICTTFKAVNYRDSAVCSFVSERAWVKRFVPMSVCLSVCLSIIHYHEIEYKSVLLFSPFPFNLLISGVGRCRESISNYASCCLWMDGGHVWGWWCDGMGWVGAVVQCTVCVNSEMMMVSWVLIYEAIPQLYDEWLSVWLTFCLSIARLSLSLCSPHN